MGAAQFREEWRDGHIFRTPVLENGRKANLTPKPFPCVPKVNGGSDGTAIVKQPILREVSYL